MVGVNWYRTSTKEILHQLHLYETRARRFNKPPIVYFATPEEMEVLKAEAGDDPTKLEFLSKHYRVYEQMEEEHAYEKPEVPLNRADRRRVRFGRPSKSVGNSKRA